MLEARCSRCGDTFNPADELDLEHVARTDEEHEGEPCGGAGVIVGQWH